MVVLFCFVHDLRLEITTLWVDCLEICFIPFSWFQDLSLKKKKKLYWKYIQVDGKLHISQVYSGITRIDVFLHPQKHHQYQDSEHLRLPGKFPCASSPSVGVKPVTPVRSSLSTPRDTQEKWRGVSASDLYRNVCRTLVHNTPNQKQLRCPSACGWINTVIEPPAGVLPGIRERNELLYLVWVEDSHI